MSCVLALALNWEPARALLLPVKDDDALRDSVTVCWGSPAASNPDALTGVRLSERASERASVFVDGDGCRVSKGSAMTLNCEL